jgi:cell division protein ZapE
MRGLGNVQDPLPRIAADWAARCRVLCLTNSSSPISPMRCCWPACSTTSSSAGYLVTTSNTAPDGLYRDGLQRARFLPAIELIKRHTRVLELPGTLDFRLRILEQAEIFHFPLDARADRVMTRAFERIAADCELDRDLDVNGRNFHSRRRGDGVIWFDFAELCDKPRGSIDYIEIARAFNTVVLSGVPQLAEHDANAARRFITLVDEFYARNVEAADVGGGAADRTATGERWPLNQRTTSLGRDAVARIPCRLTSLKEKGPARGKPAAFMRPSAREHRSRTGHAVRGTAGPV